MLKVEYSQKHIEKLFNLCEAFGDGTHGNLSVERVLSPVYDEHYSVTHTQGSSFDVYREGDLFGYEGYSVTRDDLDIFNAIHMFTNKKLTK